MIEDETEFLAGESKTKQRKYAKAYLFQAYKIDSRIKCKLEQIVSLRELATKATSVLSDMPKSNSGNNSKLEYIVGKIVDLENEIIDDMDYLIELKKEITRKVKQIHNTDHQKILELHYLCFKPWDDIATEMNYSIGHVFRLHNEALESFAKIL